MKPVSRWVVVGGLVVAFAPALAASGYAEPLPTVESTAPGINEPAPEQPMQSLGAGMSGPGSPIRLDPSDQLGPPKDAVQDTLGDCMSFWDPGTHMSKDEWRRTCQRTLNGQYF
jgi:hypothetical protein